MREMMAIANTKEKANKEIIDEENAFKLENDKPESKKEWILILSRKGSPVQKLAVKIRLYDCSRLHPTGLPYSKPKGIGKVTLSEENVDASALQGNQKTVHVKWVETNWC